MLIVTIKATVVKKKQFEFEQTMTSLLEEIEKSKECLGWEFLKEIKNEHGYCVVTRWKSKEVVENLFKSKNFKILQGAIHSLCDPSVGELTTSFILAEKTF